MRLTSELLLLCSLLPSPPSFVPPVGSASTFAIHHYCGKVVYDTYSLLNANADTIADDIVAAFNSKASRHHTHC